MKGTIAAACVALMMSLGVSAQTDSVVLPANTPMPDGIYLTYSDFRYQRLIKRDQIVSDLNRDQLEFIGKVMNTETLVYKKNDTTYKAIPMNVWGFFQNNALYLNYQKEFYRVPVFGSISYLVAQVLVVNQAFFDPRFGTTSGGGNSMEMREFIMDYYTGVTEELSLEKLELLLKRDPELFAEFNKLKKGKKKDETYRYIRKYNERHPIYFLK